MKNVCLLVLCAGVVCAGPVACGPGTADSAAGKAKAAQLRPGMSLDAFLGLFPDIERPRENDVQIGREETRHGLDGAWTYDFSGGKLDWWIWDVYVEEISAENFEKCLKAAEAMIGEFTRTCGEPGALERGETAYKDPRVQRHWGYDVIEAAWKTDEVWFKVTFRFMGAKGTYRFLVKTEFSRPGNEFF